jgi:hypothetical protein
MYWEAKMQTIFRSNRFSSHARIFSQRLYHCDPRKTQRELPVSADHGFPLLGHRSSNREKD